MKKIVKLSMVALVASLVVGCATSDDVANIQSQIDGLKSSVAQASSDASSAKAAADSASAQAASAEAAAPVFARCNNTSAARSASSAALVVVSDRIVAIASEISNDVLRTGTNTVNIQMTNDKT